MKPEARVQQQILSYLRLNRIFHWRSNTGRAVMVTNGRKRFVSFGILGQPDILACVRGRFVGIECKAPKGIQSPHQKIFQQKLEEAGGVYVLARSVEDVKEVLDGLISIVLK